MEQVWAWALPGTAPVFESGAILARRIARAGEWTAWVWTPGAAAWATWWEHAALVEAVAAETPPPPPVFASPDVAAAAVAAPSRATGPTVADVVPSVVPGRGIRSAPPDIESFFRDAARRQGPPAVKRFERESRTHREKGDWLPVSLLKLFGYTVAESVGLDGARRREILEDFLFCELPTQWKWRDEWYAPATQARLEKVVGFILNHNVRLQRDNVRKADAVEKWEADAHWLQTTYRRRA